VRALCEPMGGLLVRRQACGSRDRYTPLLLLCVCGTMFTVANVTLIVLICSCHPKLQPDGSTAVSDAGQWLVLLWPLILALNVAGGTVMLVGLICCCATCSRGSHADDEGDLFDGKAAALSSAPATHKANGATESTTLIGAGAEGSGNDTLKAMLDGRRRLPLIVTIMLLLSIVLSYVLAFTGPSRFFEPVMGYVASAVGFTWRPEEENTLLKQLDCALNETIPVEDCLPGQPHWARNAGGRSCRRVPTPSPHFNPSTQRCDCHSFFGNATAASPSGQSWGDADNHFPTARVCRENDPPVREGRDTRFEPVRFPNVTFVTSFVNIGRISSNSDCYYLKPFLQWAQLKINLEVHAAPGVLDAVSSARRFYGHEGRTRVWALNSFDDLPFSELRPQMYRNVLKSVWRQALGSFSKGRDSLIPEYGLINHAKIGFLRRSILSNVFGSEFFFWVDFGAGYEDVAFRGPTWCPCTATVAGALTFASRAPDLVSKFTEQTYWGNTGSDGTACMPSCGYWEDPWWPTNKAIAAPVGGMWGGDANMVLRLFDVYQSLLLKMTNELGFVDVDQPLYSIAYNRDPSWMRILTIDGEDDYAFYPYRGFC